MVTTISTSGELSGHPGLPSNYDRETEVLALESTKTGVKGLVDSGLSKIPQIFLNTTTKAVTATPAVVGIPIIDLEGIWSSEERKEAVVKELKKACSEWGFFQVVNHGVPATVLEGIVDGVRRFHEMEDDVKKTYYSRDGCRKFKYNTNFDLLTGKVANWRDSLCCIMGPDPPHPQEVPEVCRDIIFEYTKEMKRVGIELLELMSMALGLRPDHLKELEIADGMYLQGHYYPACPEAELAIGTSSHADNCFFTILLQDNTGGLQILHDDYWVDVPPFPDALVVNIGDLLQLITNDQFKSVIHRVLAKGVGPRISVPCFFRTHFDQPIERCRVYGPITELLSAEQWRIQNHFDGGQTFTVWIFYDLRSLNTSVENKIGPNSCKEKPKSIKRVVSFIFLHIHPFRSESLQLLVFNGVAAVFGVFPSVPPASQLLPRLAPSSSRLPPLTDLILLKIPANGGAVAHPCPP